MLLFDKTEEVICWLEVESDGADGLIEDVVVLPQAQGEAEDAVYYVVQRTINSATVRYLERWATEAQCIGGQLCRLADSFVVYDGLATTSITGLTHLRGEEVVVWANGEDVGYDSDEALIYTVSATGTITLAAQATKVVVGLPYRGRWKSGKLVQLLNQMGIALKDHKLIEQLGIIAADIHRKGVKFGPDFDNLDDLPSVEDGAAVDANAVRTDYDSEPIPFPGTWTIDSRICLEGKAPRPCTLLALVAGVTTS